MSAWVLLLIIMNPGDAHASTQQVPMVSQVACEAGRAKMLASNATLRADGFRQQMVAVCVEHKL